MKTVKTFILNSEQEKKAIEWEKNHRKECKLPTTIVEGRISYVFTPTGARLITEIRCLCGKDKDLTRE